MNRFHINIHVTPPPAHLEKEIFVRLEKEMRKKTIFHAWTNGFVALASCGATLFSAFYFIQNMQISGFYDFFSLIFSDGTSLASYWKEFAFSLAESIPLMSLMLVLTFLGVAVWFLSRTTYSVQRMRIIT